MNQYTKEEISKIKESAKLLLDVINTCPGGESWLRINDVTITGDVGYAMEFCENILKQL